MYLMTNINNVLHVTNIICASDFVKTTFYHVIMNYCYKLVLDYS